MSVFSQLKIKSLRHHFSTANMGRTTWQIKRRTAIAHAVRAHRNNAHTGPNNLEEEPEVSCRDIAMHTYLSIGRQDAP
jgi:hypothetical protein